VNPRLEGDGKEGDGEPAGGFARGVEQPRGAVSAPPAINCGSDSLKLPSMSS